MSYGIMFQEYHCDKKPDFAKMATYVRILWVVVAMFVAMALTGNLKSSLIKKRYEKRTLTLNEVVSKDMTIHMSDTLEDYLTSGMAQSQLNARILCQANKKPSKFVLNRLGFILLKAGPL